MTMTHHPDRRTANGPDTETWIDGHELVQTAGDTPVQETRIPLDDIRQVRLSVEMAARANQVVCAVSTGDGRVLRFGSMRCIGPARWESSVESFNPLLKQLHTDLAGRGDAVRYVEGQPASYLLTLFALATVITAASLYYFATLFFVQQNTMGLFLLGLTAAGGWMMRLFWPRRIKTYDPAIYRDAKP